ncbi:SKP1-like protein 11 [Lotus japonicus]|uniref:SKP1-like protein 11 n=1 Tax=Lotus japonicus TaxID=34305 RepID=UPI002588BC62|nr:SKP1-like protein 11 [Lotus japonicus]
MTIWLLRFFHYLDRECIIKQERPSLKETSFLSFYDLVHDKINKQVGDAILDMIDQEHAGVQIDQTLVNNALVVYSEIGDIPRKNNAKHFTKIMIQKLEAFHYDEASNRIEEKLEKLTLSSKKIRLVSSNGDVFEVDYGVALMSKTIEDAIKTKPASGSDSILVSTVSSNILVKVIEYCKKHIEASNPHYNVDISGLDIKDWDAEFVRVDNHTLFDLHLCANYLNIKSLLQLTSTTIGNMVRGKDLVEIQNIFSIK